MERDRFDDVAFTLEVEHEPLSPRARLRRRVAAVLATAIVGFGGLAAAADALTSSGSAATSGKGKITYYGDGAVRDGKVGHPCHRFRSGSFRNEPGEMHRFDPNRGDGSSTFKY
jgi:hypothetical protein